MQVFVQTYNRDPRLIPLSQHLRDKEFPIGKITMFDGLYYKRDFKIIKERARLFEQWADLEEETYHREDTGRQKNICININFLNILKKIEDTTLVIEADAFFVNLTYGQLIKQITNLYDVVGKANVHVAQLYYHPPRPGYSPLNVQPIDTFWGRGTAHGGQVANIWTKHGAEYFLNLKTRSSIENYFTATHDMPGKFTSLNCEVIQNI